MVIVGCLVTIIVVLLFTKKMCISPHAPSKKRQITEVHISLQICGSSVWNLLHVTLVAPRIWRWLLDFRKIYGPLTYTGLNWSSYQICNISQMLQPVHKYLDMRILSGNPLRCEARNY
jgi:hypothetical protein